MQTAPTLAPIPPDPDAEDAHKTGHKSARSPRVDVIPRGERRRSWAPEQKREIVLESLGPELTPTEVARKYAVGTGLLYGWRQQILGGPLSPLGRPTPCFAQVEMTPSQPAAPEAAAPEAKPQQPMTLPEPEAPVRPAGLIEIVLSGGVTVRVDGGVNKQALRRVLDAMAGR
jgi:transposase